MGDNYTSKTTTKLPFKIKLQKLSGGLAPSSFKVMSVGFS